MHNQIITARDGRTTMRRALVKAQQIGLVCDHKSEQNLHLERVICVAVSSQKIKTRICSSKTLFQLKHFWACKTYNKHDASLKYVRSLNMWQIRHNSVQYTLRRKAKLCMIIEFTNHSCRCRTLSQHPSPLSRTASTSHWHGCMVRHKAGSWACADESCFVVHWYLHWADLQKYRLRTKRSFWLKW